MSSSSVITYVDGETITVPVDFEVVLGALASGGLQVQMPDGSRLGVLPHYVRKVESA